MAFKRQPLTDGGLARKDAFANVLKAYRVEAAEATANHTKGKN